LLKKYRHSKGCFVFKCEQYDILFIIKKQGRRKVGRAGGALKKLRAMETYEKQINRYQLSLLLFNNNVDLKNNKRNYRKCISIRS